MRHHLTAVYIRLMKYAMFMGILGLWAYSAELRPSSAHPAMDCLKSAWEW